ncbi:hypothetical protein ABGB17_00195 [Sphaerisporangium sp. B11E5]|uniref:hypothetical protein n=1 Tax=Sphaerisporangium sp. B11E5 TaxID=3153563 RepID=UPI00325D56BF
MAECSEVAKGGGAGEDRVVVLEDEAGVRCAAVVDGATDKSGRDHGGVTGGALAAEEVVRTLRRLDPGSGPDAGVTALTEGMRLLRSRWGVGQDDPAGPCAVVAVAWPRDGVVWRVGDVHVALGHEDGSWERHAGEKAVDRVLADTRAAYLHALLASGTSAGELARDDPGRELIMPVLRRQGALANRDGRFGYGVVDGRAVPPRFVDVLKLRGDCRDVVLASDGYLRAAPTLQIAERELASSLRADPLRIGEFPATKGVPPGAGSFDDRAYLRLVRRS